MTPGAGAQKRKKEKKVQQDFPAYAMTLEDHLMLGMGSAWLKPEVRENIIKLLRQDGKEKLELLLQALGRGHTYSRDPVNGEYFASMTHINRLIRRLKRESDLDA